jgi:hypothetical protein
VRARINTRRWLNWSPPSNDEMTAWVATARIRTADKAIVPLRLAPRRITPGPHGDFNALMLAVAKRGEPVIPARLAQLSFRPPQSSICDLHSSICNRQL